MDAQGKVTLVTGGTGGLGRGVCRVFAEAGAVVTATFLDDAGLHAFREALGPLADRVTLVRADVSREADVRRVIEGIVARHGRLDVSLHLVGGYAEQPVDAIEEAAWDRLFTLNLKTAMLCTKHALAQMKRQGHGRIVNVSARPSLSAYAEGAAYCASKAGVNRLTEAAAAEVRDTGITVNAVLPSMIDTPQNRRAMPDADFAEWVKPEEIGRVLLFLASDAAAIISGALIPVYGRS